MFHSTIKLLLVCIFVWVLLPVSQLMLHYLNAPLYNFSIPHNQPYQTLQHLISIVTFPGQQQLLVQLTINQFYYRLIVWTFLVTIIIDLLEFGLVAVDSNIGKVGMDHIRLAICLVVLHPFGYPFICNTNKYFYIVINLLELDLVAVVSNVGSI